MFKVNDLAISGYLYAETPRQTELAHRYDVLPDIHCEDYIFNTIYHLHQSQDAALANYFKNGRDSAEQLSEIARRHSVSVRSILDFAAGYGCVTRHLSSSFPSTETVVAMDIHEHAFWFNQGHLKVRASVSETDPSEVKSASEFDLVAALSFFSHMPEKSFGAWIGKLSEFVAPGGLLIFTTHGEKSHREIMPRVEVDSRGYGFLRESEQFDLSVDDYGHAVTYEPFVREQIAVHAPGMALVEIMPGFWWTHQDCFVLKRLREGDETPELVRTSRDWPLDWQQG